jgi:hypothetical protein
MFQRKIGVVVTQIGQGPARSADRVRIGLGLREPFSLKATAQSLVAAAQYLSVAEAWARLR